MEALFFAALDRGTAAQRAAFLESACAGDAELRQQVEKLLDAHPKVGDFLKQPAMEQWIAASESPAAAHEGEPPANGEGARTPDQKGFAAARSEAEKPSDDEGVDLGFLEPSQRPDSLGRLGHYEVLAVLGTGGFGTVLRAFDDVLQRVVAVKVMAPQMAAASPARKRFLREARASAKVRHENVVQVYAVEEKPLPYLVMEFIPGETLQQHLDRTGPMDLAETVRIGRQIAEGLAAAHATDLIHRDIKPANVLIETGPQEHVRITDFGLARAAADASLSRSGLVAGTPMYMSPEQAKGNSFDVRADLFSLGSVLYVMATGRPPFRASSTLAVLRRVVEDQPRPIRELIPEVPDWLCAIVAKLQAKDPADRFQTAREVADLLADCEAKLKARQDVANILPAPAVKPAAQPAPTGRKKWVAGTAVLLAILALVVTEFARVTHWFQGQQPTANPIQPVGEPKPPPQVATTDTPPNVVAKQETSPPAVAPFDPARARELQEAWAKHLGVPVETTSKIGMKLILIPPAGALLPRAYYLGKYEVTQGEWEHVMDDNPSAFGPKNPKRTGTDTSQFPVASVNWYECVEFCNKLSEREGLPPYYELTVEQRATGNAIDAAEAKILGGAGYHLPTDPEWEHACRAGSKTKYHFGDKDELLPEYAWFDENSSKRPHAVGELKPNAFGLHDMHGNVREWNEEMLTNATSGAPERMHRGGYWLNPAGNCAVNYRPRLDPAHSGSAYGLRLARASSGEAGLNPPPFVPLTLREKKLQEDWATKLNLPVETTNKIGMELILIPPAGAAVPKAYYLGKYEVTQGDWEQVMEDNPSGFGPKNPKMADMDTRKLPVDQVSWFDSVEFCNKLSERDGFKPYYELGLTKRSGTALEEATVKVSGGNGYHIPTDAEWDHGCRAGTKGKYNFRDSDEDLLKYAWFAKNSKGRTHAVGAKKPNGFGLYDTLGNVHEWNEETLMNATSGASERVCRGGAWNSPAPDCAVAPGTALVRPTAITASASAWPVFLEINRSW